MDEFGFNNMSDEEFRRMFTRILNERQREMERFLKSFYGDSFFNPRTGFSGQSRNDRFFNDLNFFDNRNTGKNDQNDFFNIFNGLFGDPLNDMGIEKGRDEFGPWENKSWTSPDGSTSYNSFKRYYNSGNNYDNQNDIDTIKLLEIKLNNAIKEEKYEDAAKIRDLISSLKDDKKGDQK